MQPNIVKIGCCAGFSGDRYDAGVPVAEALALADGPAYLMYETLAERTLALAQIQRRCDPEVGYTPYLADFLRPVLRTCLENGIPIVGNFGAANPPAAARRILALANELNLSTPCVATVEGDDVLESFGERTIRSWNNDEKRDLTGSRIIAANAYLGGRPIADALSDGADIVVTGRCTDSALAVGPLIHAFGLQHDEWDRLATAVLTGHLLECGAHVTGGYFADPGYKDVPGMASIGFPIAEVSADDIATITKPPRTGGLVSAATVTEQLLYEIHDPSAYLTPDVQLNMTDVEVEDLGENRVRVMGARGAPPPGKLKVTVSIEGDFLAEGEIGYSGLNALARARLAARTLLERIELHGSNCAVRCDIIGAASIHDSIYSRRWQEDSVPSEGDYRVRLAGSTQNRAEAENVAREVLSLYANGPAGGAGVRYCVTPRVHTLSSYISAADIKPKITFYGQRK